MTTTSFVRYSVIAGALFAIALYVSGIFQVDSRQRALLERAIRENPEVMNTIGEYREMSIRKVTKYAGSPKDSPYIKRLMRVEGENGVVYVWITIMNPNSNNERVVINSIEH